MPVGHISPLSLACVVWGINIFNSPSSERVKVCAAATARVQKRANLIIAQFLPEPHAKTLVENVIAAGQPHQAHTKELTHPAKIMSWVAATSKTL
jgi:hypothetical protein